MTLEKEFKLAIQNNDIYKVKLLLNNEAETITIENINDLKILLKNKKSNNLTPSFDYSFALN
jgi:hypothetical protein